MNDELITNTKEVESTRKRMIALRITDDYLYARLNELAKEQGISLNLTVIMLLSYAFNEADRQKKKLVRKFTFEAKHEENERKVQPDSPMK